MVQPPIRKKKVRKQWLTHVFNNNECILNGHLELSSRYTSQNVFLLETQNSTLMSCCRLRKCQVNVCESCVYLLKYIPEDPKFDVSSKKVQLTKLLNLCLVLGTIEYLASHEENQTVTCESTRCCRS